MVRQRQAGLGRLLTLGRRTTIHCNDDDNAPDVCMCSTAPETTQPPPPPPPLRSCLKKTSSDKISPASHHCENKKRSKKRSNLFCRSRKRKDPSILPPPVKTFSAASKRTLPKQNIVHWDIGNAALIPPSPMEYRNPDLWWDDEDLERFQQRELLRMLLVRRPHLFVYYRYCIARTGHVPLRRSGLRRVKSSSPGANHRNNSSSSLTDFWIGATELMFGSTRRRRL